MRKPKMIIFDYGHTLCYEPGLDLLRGEEALFRYVTKNKDNLTYEQINEFSNELFERIDALRGAGLEFHEWKFRKFMMEYLGVEFSVSMPEMERILWENSSAGNLMPNVDRMIDCVNAKGIRSAVISNISWSGAALAERINRLLPQNRFEFIIASSEYMFRKPNPMLYKLALRKAGLEPQDVWYCGDNVRADVEGSAAVGIFPVWYECLELVNTGYGKNEGVTPECEHLHVNDWMEMAEALEGLGVL